ncbi:hypothetical protein FLACHUCJ7_00514 [Flavobacterium chungangense]|uniref:Uncharacterized protein n=1 Tax=Flavobacterium chungangense TaxID=554283 RepID=A0A6V6YRS6_9FLAO|nr:hypothetical protein FLACHUCJ7_00514 [Flavobacterium chungangense]
MKTNQTLILLLTGVLVSTDEYLADKQFQLK